MRVEETSDSYRTGKCWQCWARVPATYEAYERKLHHQDLNPKTLNPNQEETCPESFTCPNKYPALREALPF